MSKAFPDTFYHSISQTRLKAAIHSETLPGLSKFHLDPEGKNPGVWLTDKLEFVLKNGYGREQTNEVLDIWDSALMAKITKNPDAKPLEIKRYTPGIILEITDLEEDKLQPHPVAPSQFFYNGNLDWKRIKRFFVAEKDIKTEATARDLAAILKKERGVEVEVRTFRPLDYLREDEPKRESVNKFDLSNGENEKRI